MRAAHPGDVRLRLGSVLGVGIVRGALRPDAGQIGDVDLRKKQIRGLSLQVLWQAQTGDIEPDASRLAGIQLARIAEAKLADQIRPKCGGVAQRHRLWGGPLVSFLTVGPFSREGHTGER